MRRAYAGVKLHCAMSGSDVCAPSIVLVAVLLKSCLQDDEDFSAFRSPGADGIPPPGVALLLWLVIIVGIRLKAPSCVLCRRQGSLRLTGSSGAQEPGAHVPALQS